MSAPRLAGEATVDTSEMAVLRRELLLATTSLEVALALLEPLGEYVEDYADQALILRYVAGQWLALDPAVQQTYSRQGFPHSGVMWFAWAWFEATNLQPFAGLREESCPAEADAEARLHRHWRAIVRRLRKEVGS